MQQADGTCVVAKFCSIPDFNKQMNMNITSDHIYKLKKLTSSDIANAVPNSFAAKYGHLTFEKIKEDIVFQFVRVN